MTGDSPVGAVMDPRAKRRLSAFVIGSVANDRAIAPLQNRRTALTDGCFAKNMQPNTTRVGIILPG